jgi:hypothetical protein
MSSSERVVEQFHDLFLASAGVAGALIGLLFVAISVAPHRVTGDAAELAHRIRASAALTAFTNALTISLFALIPTVGLGTTTAVVGGVGLLFVAGSLLSVLRLRRTEDVAFRDVTFLVGLVAVFVGELLAGIHLSRHDDRSGSVSTIAILMIVCFIVGIARAWELIGAQSIGLTSEVVRTVRDHGHGGPVPTAGSRPAPDEHTLED